MKTKVKALVVALFLAPVTAWAGDEDDFGTWVELGVEKALPCNLEVGISADLRTENNSQRVDRWDIGANVGYRLNKYLKFAVGYQFLSGYNTDKTSKEEADRQTGELLSYRYTPSYWTPRHRFNIEATGAVKLWKWLRISLRERYQYTYQPEKTVTGRYDTEAPDWEQEPAKDKVIESDNRQMLRTRLKLEYDKKRCKWSPFVACELQNNVVNDLNLDKIRTSAGVSYKINRNNDISLSYVLTCDRTEQPHQRMHALCIGYCYDF